MERDLQKVYFRWFCARRDLKKYNFLANPQQEDVIGAKRGYGSEMIDPDIATMGGIVIFGSIKPPILDLESILSSGVG